MTLIVCDFEKATSGARRQFLHDWAELGDGVVNEVIEYLIENGYLEWKE